MQAPASCSALNAARSEYSIHTTLKPAQDLQLESMALLCFFDKWQWTLCASKRLIQVALSQKSWFKQPHGFQELPHKIPSAHILGLLRKPTSGLNTFPLPPHVGLGKQGTRGCYSTICNIVIYVTCCISPDTPAARGQITQTLLHLPFCIRNQLQSLHTADVF